MAFKRLDRGESEKQVTFEGVIGPLMPFITNRFNLEIELGRAKMSIRDLLELEAGSLIELKKSAGEPLDVYTKEQLIMRGEVTVLEDTLGLRVTEIVDPNKKV